MLTNEEFAQLIARTKTGDQDAAASLIAEYEPEIRRAARLRLTDPDMRRLVDSMDIAQSVFGRFFRQVNEGETQLERPEQLLALLTRITRNRIIDEHRRQTAQKRGGKNDVADLDLALLTQAGPGPKTTAVARELLEHARSRLSAEELTLMQRRSEGESWEEISRDTGQKPDAVRKRLERALQRVREEMESADD
ncbi:MAG: sigma-70 family RNA polymerase sigma factor [Planctomycetaceae bacterium]|nr:sigma-70 family RNA polymerase sigma factor [Planctomycetaceae bacterium]